MTRSVAILIIFITALAISGCNRSSASADRLELAETLMWSAPDSALTVLESVSPDSLAKGEEKARYALLYTMAMDKNHLEPANDSLIASAVDYYKSKDNIPRLMVANFYRGRVLQHNGRHPQALLSFYQAKELAEKSDSSFWAGMACRGISDIYGENYNLAEELTFAQKEYEYIKKSGRQPYLNYALHDVGRAYDNNGDYHKATAISAKLIDSASITQDPYLYYCALQLKSHSLINNENYTEAYPILMEICEMEVAECKDSLALCRVLAQTGQTNDALTLLEKTSNTQPEMKEMIKHVIYKKNNQFEKAVNEGEVVDNMADSILRVSMSRNIAGTISEYFEMKKIFSEAELMISRLRTWLLIIVFIVTVSLLTVIIIYVYRRQRHEIDQKVLFAGELQEELKQNRKYLDRTMENLDKTKEELAKSNKDLDKTKEDLAKSKMNLDKIKDDLAKSKEELDRTKDDLAKSIEDLDTSKTENKHAFDVIKFLWSTKYELLEQMAEINIYNTSSKMVRQKIADTVTKLIDDFKYHSDKIVELEKDVDLLYDNLFSDFRRDLPNLKDADYRLYLFSILRISNNTITLFLEENNVEAVYNRKRRLKDKIKKLETYIADRYLDYF